MSQFSQDIDSIKMSSEMAIQDDELILKVMVGVYQPITRPVMETLVAFFGEWADISQIRIHKKVMFPRFNLAAPDPVQFMDEGVMMRAKGDPPIQEQPESSVNPIG